MGRISMPQGKGSQLHNRRDYDSIGRSIPDNIDVSRSSENVTLVDRDIRQAYKKIFGEALKEYNDKQKRADRKIDDYYTHIEKSKNGEKLFYEDVVQWGKKEDFNNPYTLNKAKEALIEYAESFEQRNPNLKLIGAYIHMDEASPHLHLDYIPVAHGYSRGLKTRNALDRAMKQMGYVPANESRQNNATKMWKEHERAVFGHICRNYGLEVEPERESTRANMSPDEYKQAKDKMIGDIVKERNDLIGEVEDLKSLKTDIAEVDIQELRTKLPFGYVAVKREALEEIKEQARAYTANRDEVREVRERSASVAQKEKDLNKKEKEIRKEAKEMVKLNKQIHQMYNRQRKLNEVLEEVEAERDKLKEQVEANQERERELDAEHKQEVAELKEQITKAKSSLESNTKLMDYYKNYAIEKKVEGYRILTDVVKAIGMLKYDKQGDYKIENLSENQGRLIDAVAEYGAERAREAGYEQMANSMEKMVGVSDDIEKTIDPDRGRYHHEPER